VVAAPDANEGWIITYPHGPADLIFHALPAQDSPPLPEGDRVTVPGHTIIVSQQSRGGWYNADWVEDGWRITVAAEPSEGATINRDEWVSLLNSLPWR
jgi:hypothetical protein